MRPDSEQLRLSELWTDVPCFLGFSLTIIIGALVLTLLFVMG